MIERPVTQAEVDRCCHRLVTSEEFRPLLTAWEMPLTTATVPAGPVDPMRLAMAQGDRERLWWLRHRAEIHRQTLTKE